MEVVVKKLVLSVMVIGAVGAACAENGPRQATGEEIPESVRVEAGTMTTGFASDRVHRKASVDAYRIGKTLVSVARYKQCIAAGACTAPSLHGGVCDRPSPSADGRTFDAGDELPVSCVTPTQASAYCAWVGGSLAGEAEWLLAARGPEPARFSWGSAQATCEQHPSAVGCQRTGDAFQISKHPKGASARGVEDVLLTPGELVAHTRPTDSCPSPGPCAVQSTYPGDIVGVLPVDGAELKPWVRSYGFRCMWTGGAK